ncbi:MAG: hypothetical protein K0S86_3602 [Geminicoccaceae bacterium]|nr:hypothetical protein [Geminicoccaceae bacterium]
MTTHAIFGRGVALLLGSGIILASAASPAAAQSADEQSAYLAMIYTTVGGLPPLPPSTDSLGRTIGSGFVLHGRLGHTSRSYGPTLNGFGVGVEFPTGRYSFGGTLAYLSASCDADWAGDASECAGDIMIGGTVRATLASRPLGGTPASPRKKGGARPRNENSLLVGVDGSLGYSPRQGEQALAIAGGVPTAIVLERGDLRILPFITPGVGYGRLGNVSFFEDERPTAHGKFVFMLGGGVGLEFGRSGMGASVGFQRVLKSSGGATQIGLGMTWSGAATARR